MLKYAFNRLPQAVIVLILVSFIAFSVLAFIPGDAAVAMLGIDATPEEVATLRAELNLDKPFLTQYYLWLKDAVRGDLGESIYYNEPVLGMFLKRLPITLYLNGIALIGGVLFGITLGIIAAMNRGKIIDSLVNVFANIGVSMPQFWIGILCIYLFALKLSILPTQGYTSPTVDLVDSLRKAILPVVLMSLGPMAIITRQTRSAVLETLAQDYVRTAVSKGLLEHVVIIKHILRNSLIPVITLLGMIVRSLVGGSLLAEQIFNIPGMGRLIIASVQNRDFPMVQGCVLLVAFVVVLANLLVDLAYGWVDPRIRKN